MPLIFPNEFTHILRHSSDETTLDLQICPSYLFWLSLSPTSISLYSGKINKFLAKYPLSPEQTRKFGFFTQATWVSDQQFAVLFSAGFIFLFSLADSFIKLENIFDSEPNSTRLTITSFHNEYVVCGDDLGFISFLSSTKKEKISIQIADFPIKKLFLTDNYGLILSAEGTPFSFPITDTVISNIKDPNFHFTLSCLSQNTASSISLSNTNIAAIFETNNNICVTECGKPAVENVCFKSKSAAGRALVSFGDSFTLFLIYRNGFVAIWNYIMRVQRSFKFPDLINCNCVSVSNNYLYVSNDTGIFVLPLFSLCYLEYPLLKGPSSIVEFRPVKKGAIPIKYELPIEDSIFSVTADENEQYIAVSLENRIILIDRSNSLIISKEKLQITAKHIQFSGHILCAVELESFQYFLKFISIQSSNFETISTFDLPSAPIGLSCDSKGCVVLFQNHISVFDNFKFLQNIEIEATPMHCHICSNSRKIVLLLRNRKLLLIEYGEVVRISLITEGCSDFFYDPNFSLVFVIKGIHVKFCSLTNMKLIPFCECADYPIGIISSCSAILFLPTNNFTPTINYFFDFSIVSEMQNPTAAAQTILPMRNSSFFANLLRQISVFALREKMGKNLVIFLTAFPEHFKFCLSSALRSVESPERKAVFENYGTASEIFAKFAGLSMDSHRSGIVVFNEKNEVAENDTRSAAILLPVVMEEEGPNIAFPAAFYILNKLHYDLDYIESLFRFLDPLVSPCESTEDDGKVSAVGMIMEIKDYQELKKRLQACVDFCLIDLVNKFMPHLLIPLAFSAQVPLVSFFQMNKNIDQKANLITVLDKVAPLLTEMKATKQELKGFAEEALHGGWEIWPIAMFILVGESVKAAKLLNTRRQLMSILSKSQWMHLI